ncbi:flagellar filament capping protein FliD [Zestomonas thermotolerans]|uniref:flagellar filament capping protein FliD n=1 Tax=Zestomonas thermotolerans TaxID=157784 RepID=UPI00035F87D5|nr:flagellar filament capping protein FliD [Pseudomonas thermotolerans]
MAIDSDYVQQMATQLASYDVQAAQAKAQRNQTSYQSQLDAVTKLDSALKTFKSAASGLKSNGSLLVNSATFSKEGMATASVSPTALSGSYQFFVKQLASAHQQALNGLKDSDLTGSGSLTLTQNGESFTVNMDGITSLADLAKAINAAEDNTGVKATLVRSNGEVSLVLASEKSGKVNEISLSSTNAAVQSAWDGSQPLSPARDAEVYLGGEGGMKLTNSSNTFEDIITGVSLTFTQVHQSGEAPLTVSIDKDQKATQDKANTFINAFNTLMSTFDTLTASGSEDSRRGALAGDSSVRSIESMLNQLIRTSFGGKSLVDFGISADRSGKLTIDSTRFEKAIAADPEGFDKLFSGKGNLLETLDKNLAVYTNSTNGVLKNRKESLNSMLKRIDEQFDTIQKQYDMYYSRYLKQYTNLMQTMATMEQTAGMFT